MRDLADRFFETLPVTLVAAFTAVLVTAFVYIQGGIFFFLAMVPLSFVLNEAAVSWLKEAAGSELVFRVIYLASFLAMLHKFEVWPSRSTGSVASVEKE